MATKLQTLASFWKNFGLASVQKNLDEVAAEITARQDDSDNSRKVLIELLREFKKTNTDEVKQSVSPVVKSFQQEVDNLVKRSKAAEKAFLDIYRDLADMPDPLPILEQSIDRNQQLASKIQDYEIEVKQLRETMGDQAHEITELKTKEKKIEKLEALVNQYDKNIDETMQSKLAIQVEKIQSDFDEKQRILEDAKLELEKKCKEAENVANSNQNLLEQAQSELYETSIKLAQKADAKSDDFEMIMNDLETANHRAALAEKEVENLKDQIQTMTEKIGNAGVKKIDLASDSLNDLDMIKELQEEILAKEREISVITTETNKLHTESASNKLQAHQKITNLEATNLQLTSKVETLETKLKVVSDYDSIKKDLSILRTLEFGDDAANGTSEQRPLEVMILERSKALQSENTSLRMEKERLSSELSDAKGSLAERVNEAEQQAQLISELEDHVEKLQDLSNVYRGEAEGRSSTDILYDLDIGGAKVSGRDSPVSMSSSFMEKNNAGDASSLLPIIQAQRERFKRRNEELEDQQSKQIQHISLMQTEIKDLQADNVKLYEKIRFLQGYQSSVPKRDDSVMIPVETRYKSQYEQRLDPFTTFSNQEKQRKYTQLNIVEKIILSMVHFMLSNKIARLFVFAYSVLLHGLVFLVLMRMAYSDSYRRDHAASEWQQKFMDHMNEAHQDLHRPGG